MNIKGYLDKARHGSRYRFGGSKDQTTQTTTSSSNTQINTSTTLDGGAIAGAFGFASQVAGGVVGLASDVAKTASANEVHAYDYADSIFHSSLDAMNKNDGRAFDAFDRAATITKDSLLSVRDAYDNASHIQSSAVDQIQNAYADSKGTTQSQQKIMLAVLAVAGVAVVASIKMKA